MCFVSDPNTEPPLGFRPAPPRSHLCEFIEDCEYTQLSTGILHLLGQRGPVNPPPPLAPPSTSTTLERARLLFSLFGAVPCAR